MSSPLTFLKSSIGRKILMAVTGFVLVGFIAGHLVGNLQIFSHPDKINGYAHFLQGIGPALWAVRLGLFACVFIHLWAAISLSIENLTARGVKYSVKNTIQATLTSRYMRWTGGILLFFIAYHLAHFTTGTAQHGTFKTQIAEYTMQSDFHLMGLPVLQKGAVVHDVHSMVVLGFQNPVVAIFYIIATTLLGFHLWHGGDSLFQTLGLRTGRWSCCLRRAVAALCILYMLGSAAIPAGVLAGIVKPACEQPSCPAAPSDSASLTH